MLPIKMVPTAIRAGLTIERVGRLDGKGVSAATIAQQLTDQNKHGQKFTTTDVAVYLKVYKQAKSTVGITEKQTQALLDDQKIVEALAQES